MEVWDPRAHNHCDDMKEVKEGFECGITIKGFNDIEQGDIIEAYEIIEVKQKLESNRS